MKNITVSFDTYSSDINDIPQDVRKTLAEAGEAIREIIKELDKKPIVIKILNIRVDTARDLVFKIYNKTNDIEIKKPSWVIKC